MNTELKYLNNIVKALVKISDNLARIQRKLVDVERSVVNSGKTRSPVWSPKLLLELTLDTDEPNLVLIDPNVIESVRPGEESTEVYAVFGHDRGAYREKYRIRETTQEVADQLRLMYSVELKLRERMDAHSEPKPYKAESEEV